MIVRIASVANTARMKTLNAKCCDMLVLACARIELEGSHSAVVV